MKRLLTAAAIALAAGLAACATATPYQPATQTAAGPRNGFYEMPLEQNRWRVGFAGNTVTSRQQVEERVRLGVHRVVARVFPRERAVRVLQLPRERRPERHQ